MNAINNKPPFSGKYRYFWLKKEYFAGKIPGVFQKSLLRTLVKRAGNAKKYKMRGICRGTSRQNIFSFTHAFLLMDLVTPYV